MIRVGGGENWDKAYRAVLAANQEQEGGYKYHPVGGAAGTVSPSELFVLGMQSCTSMVFILIHTQSINFYL